MFVVKTLKIDIHVDTFAKETGAKNAPFVPYFHRFLLIFFINKN